MRKGKIMTATVGQSNEKQTVGNGLARSGRTGIAIPGGGAWTKRRENKQNRLAAVLPWMKGPILSPDRITHTLETVIHPEDRVVIEGDNQKQADFLSRSLVAVAPKKIHDLHLIISSISRPEHLTFFELGIARKIDFSFAGPQSLRVAQLLEDGVLEIGAIHTYIELYARLFVDLIPDVVLVCAEKADREGNLFTAPNTEDTPAAQTRVRIPPDMTRSGSAPRLCAGVPHVRHE